MSEPQSGAEVLARIKPRLREESTHICLRPDLLQEWEELDEQLTEIRQRNATRPGRMADKADADEVALAERIQQVEAEIEATQLRVTMRAMPKDEWQRLIEQHPPRKQSNVDQFSGYNVEAVEDAAVRACMVDPVFDEESWAEFVKVVNPSEWAELRTAVRAANVSVTETPKSQRAASVLSSRAGDSERPATGE